ncbi:transposase-like protein [Bacillus sp. RC145]|uniref:Uncharacterized protein n=1 Tax=Bacillus mycoides TaxID=1405 RepID=A0A1E8AY56_BACMY|nr:hypothetical protein BWGOE9_58700 [Bacillus mycoides]OFD69970.1 hypothetical protein BWGOE8_58510 [Bacillus mycoides]OFD82406.1 hypothetical protein BWGOE10_23580 [Bacillus mycoides]OSY06902.1 hypothetical protein BTJ48_03293 [Bacillus mycoides]PJN58455.1 hypothetical protein BAWEI_49540 [Bacillus mycoides]
MTKIAHLIEKMYGHHYTPQTISNMTKAVYIAVGICEDGLKEVLAYTIVPTESAYNSS